MLTIRLLLLRLAHDSSSPRRARRLRDCLRSRRPVGAGRSDVELYDANGALVRSDDNGVDSRQAIIENSIPPTNDLDSAIVPTLSPAAYTAIGRGVNSTTGLAVVEVYALK